jgi:hypothetical protein
MALSTKPVELDIPDAPKLRYKPLPAFDVGDYLKDYLTKFEAKGVFDHLALSGLGVQLGQLKRESLDLSTIGVLGQAFTKLVTGEGHPGDHILDHCKRFRVEIMVDDAWEKLEDKDTLNELLEFGQGLDLCYRLFMSAIGPLARRLASYDEARRQASKPPSPESQPVS